MTNWMPHHLPVLLQRWSAGQRPTAEDLRWLEMMTLQDHASATVFGITSDTVAQAIAQRLEQCLAVIPDVNQFCQDELHWSAPRLDLLWGLWLPLATLMAERRRSHARPYVQGLLGGQGTGKSTLAAILTFLLTRSGLRVCRLSLDDLYLTYAERCQLQVHDPRLRWRGPPGTHDIALGLSVLQQLHQPKGTQAVALPRFDKSAHNGAGDRTTAEWISGVDIVLFEGWFVGVRPIDPALFEHAPSPILTEADRAFARDCNTRLHDYLPLWDELDALMVLRPADYRLSKQWRQQAEQQMIQAGRPGMSAAEIDAFVDYFWRSLHPELFWPPLLRQPTQVDLVIEIAPDHTPQRIYRV